MPAPRLLAERRRPLLEACLDLDPDPDRVAVARAFVETTLADWDMAEHRDLALLLVSELSTNAILHARTPFRVVLQAFEGVLRVGVSDENPRPPVAAADADGATSGRGMHVVAAAADRWGIHSGGDGKVIWAEVGLRSEPDPDCLDLRDVDSADDAIRRIGHRDAALE